MSYRNTLLGGLLLAASTLAQANDTIYYENASARWDASQFLLAVSVGSTQPAAGHAKVDFEAGKTGEQWLNGWLKVEQNWVRLSLGNHARQGWGFAPQPAEVSWPAGTEDQPDLRDSLFGRRYLQQGFGSARYLTLYSPKPLVGLGLTTYERNSQDCGSSLPVTLYRGHFLSHAQAVENGMNASEVEPGCANQSGKVDIALAIGKQDPNTRRFSPFHYAVIDLGTQQRKLAIDNLVFYFAPQP
ncbi:hypothetical protein [Chitinimonas taiwanensis]|uniref:hypothetical protein n=1 Tax=Chitinimonas taiwanensis TaxID=240412 RepID=UPI0035B48E92